MNPSRADGRAPAALTALGVAAFLGAVVYHVDELRALGESLGPVAAFALDGGLALALVYAGVALARSDLGAADRRAVVAWSLGGGAVFAGVMGATMVVRAFEGRVIAEPVFPLLVVTEAGMLAGTLAGYYSAEARAEARRERAVKDALGFANDLIRHDLRNDLNVIGGYAELVAESVGGSAESDDNAEVIAEKAEEALDRIETTGAITKTLVDGPDSEPIDLVAVGEEMAARTEETFDTTVAVDAPPRALVAANAGVRSVVDNLIENAAEHNDAEDSLVGVEITVEDDVVRLTVRDNGPGIPEGERERLLAASRAESSGVALTRTLVEAYGGAIDIESSEAGGAAVVVTLPRADGPGATA